MEVSNSKQNVPNNAGQIINNWSVAADLLLHPSKGHPKQAQQGVLMGKDPKAYRMMNLHAHQSYATKVAPGRSRAKKFSWLLKKQITERTKRALDLTLSIIALPFALPIMALTAIAIKLDSPGPVIFKQERVGKWGKKFACYKFRSMVVDAEQKKKDLASMNEADHVVFKIKKDPRITRVGRIIRKLSIDELPQIFNIIKGDMSLVGPRPPVMIEVEQYGYDDFRRLDAIPGLTGLQQISGRSELSFERWVEFDVKYINEQSLRKDVEIILKTIPAVISGKGAY